MSCLFVYNKKKEDGKCRAFVLTNKEVNGMGVNLYTLLEAADGRTLGVLLRSNVGKLKLYTRVNWKAAKYIRGFILILTYS